MNSILNFYLRTVLPTALAGVTEEIRDLKPHMESIQQIFDELKGDVTRCVSSLLSKYTRVRINCRVANGDGFAATAPKADSKLMRLAHTVSSIML